MCPLPSDRACNWADSPRHREFVDSSQVPYNASYVGLLQTQARCEDDPPTPAMPSPARMALDFGRDIIQHLANVLQTVPDAVRAERLAICNVLP